ncbi:MAG: ammonium transporter [Coriobacteriia bacterium]|nr:ammonium transporter [Coriobacteriia bacterium]
MNPADTAWMLASSAMVLFMTPGLALFYGGMVRSKNVLSTIMYSLICMGVVSILWALLGYTLAFGPDHFGIIGGLDFAGMRGITGAISHWAPTVPAAVFVAYQCMFAIIAPALISGAFAERMKFPAWIALICGWTLLVYSPLAHWVWGGGWLGRLGVIDFAGETVIHLSSAAAALACVLVIGKRRGHGAEAYHPHNLPMTLLGAGILWFGWFGFNGGAALSSGDLAATAFLNTHFAAAAGMISWLLMEYWRVGRPTSLGAASGAVAGLVGITPSAGFVGPMAAILIGLVVGAVCFIGVSLKPRLGYDDALDVLGVHGFGGVTGMLLTGLLATTAVNSAGANGLLNGNPKLLLAEIIGIVVSAGFSFVMTFGLLKLIDATIGLRATPDAEVAGLDITEHAETAYIL